jgi:AbrB family looped-hinge helix DNA binding protein
VINSLYEARNGDRDDHEHGQTTIPKSIRDHLRLKAGDRLDFLIGDDERVMFAPGRVVYILEQLLNASQLLIEDRDEASAALKTIAVVRISPTRSWRNSICGFAAIIP